MCGRHQRWSGHFWRHRRTAWPGSPEVLQDCQTGGIEANHTNARSMLIASPSLAAYTLTRESCQTRRRSRTSPTCRHLRTNQICSDSSAWPRFLSSHAPNFSSQTAILWDLLKENTPFEWAEDHQVSFAQVQSSIAASISLYYYNPRAEVDVNQSINESNI